jgi:alpha-ketoglutarate-dependent taurine dioxygenase
VTNRTETSQYERVTVRLLGKDERPYPTPETRTPLVIEAASSSGLEFLKEFLAAHSSGIRDDIYKHGAVLLRGFKIRSAGDFEEVLSAIQGFRPMNGYFMSEKGRDPVKGTAYVFDTSTFFISGGDFRFGGVHSENYYSPDVPQFQCFCCLKRPWIGGETALFHMANAYRQLRDRLSAKIEREPFVASVIPLPSVADRYQLPENEIERFLSENNVELVEWGGDKAMLNYKPSVLCHPHTGQPSLQINLSQELKGLEYEQHFMPSYSGRKWAIHRLAWKQERVLKVLTYLVHIPRAMRHPSMFVQFVLDPIKRRLFARSRKRTTVVKPGSMPKVPRIAQRLDHEDQRLLGRAVFDHSSVFTWQAGDILIVDNLQMHHAGMPGFGPRNIKVIMGNPISIGAAAGSSGVARPGIDETYRPLHDRLVQYADQKRHPLQSAS